ncbi:hypothetical protein EJ076_21365 [Mesorhizobium sp. M7D.F.Ca.US.005.01.1.1]|uniref:tetratricopeptide repeat protein n=1 Tax=Mesorhizobium sp. M7D.F.Ca.US.005.01.1.1 TaxID=2493678 RepID=UPI000F7643ED|nr:hypothetical protein [Mesorhizobium sp. M7D.F.Ca.US.005.01.1.1]AZO43459.1 hypothetical protein EJ076_21365 [Mesorhizobium sp. M7D.F.Ca.US.005.01.1.1]
MIPKRVVSALLAALIVSAQPSLAFGGSLQLQQLSPSDRAAFDAIVSAVDNWQSDPAQVAKVQADIKNFSASHPDFVPIQVEAAYAKSLYVSDGLGTIIGSKSFTPIIVELQKRDPTYARSYILGARAFIFSGDLASARPQLAKAAELDGNAPWADLTWALLFDRAGERNKAATSARASLAKAAGQPLAMAKAIVIIARNGGVPDDKSAEMLADQIYRIEGNASTLTTVISETLDRDSFQPGLLQTLAQLAQRVSSASAPTPKFQLQIARWYLSAGYMYEEAGAARYQQDYAKAALDTLDKIQDAPDVAQMAWNLRFAIAASNDDLPQMQQLIADGEKKNYSVQTMAHNKGVLLYAQKKFKELIALYKEAGLPDDNLLARANERGGSVEFAKRYYLRQLEMLPTAPNLNGNYASFLLTRFADADGAIEYAGKAMALMPYENARQTLSLALLLKSGRYVRSGNLPEARNTFEQASLVGIDPDYARKWCFDFCDDVKAALQAFQ